MCPCGVALLAQGVQVSGLSCRHDVQLCVQHGQHSQQFTAAKLSATPPLKTRERFGRDTGKGCNISLLQAEQFAPLGNGFAKFREGLQLIFISSYWRILI